MLTYFGLQISSQAAQDVRKAPHEPGSRRRGPLQPVIVTWVFTAHVPRAGAYTRLSTHLYGLCKLFDTDVAPDGASLAVSSNNHSKFVNNKPV